MSKENQYCLANSSVAWLLGRGTWTPSPLGGQGLTFLEAQFLIGHRSSPEHVAAMGHLLCVPGLLLNALGVAICPMINALKRRRWDNYDNWWTYFLFEVERGELGQNSNFTLCLRKLHKQRQLKESDGELSSLLSLSSPLSLLQTCFGKRDYARHSSADCKQMKSNAPRASWLLLLLLLFLFGLDLRTHTHTLIAVYIQMCMCVCFTCLFGPQYSQYCFFFVSLFLSHWIWPTFLSAFCFDCNTVSRFSLC